MSVTLSLFAGVGAQFLDNNGLPLSGGLIYTYNAGTTTPLATFTTNLGNVAQPNPIILDSAGRIPGGELWLITGYGYKFVTKDFNNVLIGTYDNVPSSAQPPITNDASSIAYEQGAPTTAGSFVIGDTYLITSIGTTNFQSIGATSNTVGILFVATGVGSGTGTAEFSRTVQVKLQESVSSADFGTIGNGTTDDTFALQTAINYCIANGNKLKIPKGNYKITSPLLIIKWNGSAFDYASIDIEGERYVSGDGIASSSVTNIIPTFNNTFAIGIQNGRSIRLKDLLITGLNDFSASVSSNPSLYAINSTYVTAGCRNSRYSPYAGIVVDPFGISIPSDGGYPGLSSYYVSSASGSGGIEFIGVACSYFVTGIVLSPNGTTANCSEMTFIDCFFGGGVAGFAMCQGQSRNIQWIGGGIGNSLYGFDGQTYGLQQGYAPGIEGCNMSTCKYLFNVGIRWGNSESIRNIHAESYFSIGFFGNGNAQSREPLAITGCEFNAYNLNTNIYVDHDIVTYTPLIFTACTFGVQGVAPFRIFANAAIIFDTCAIPGVNPLELCLGLSNNSGAGATYNYNNFYFRNCYAFDSVRGGINGYCYFSNENSYAGTGNINNSYIPLGATVKFSAEGNANDWQFCGGFWNSVSLGTLALTISSLGVGSVTVSDGTVVNTGDLIVNLTATNYENWDGTITLSDCCCAIGIVSAVVGNVITIQGLPQNLTAGTYNLSTTWYSRYHLASTGDISTSTSVANVTNVGTWLIGNHIKGAGIVNGTYITNVIGNTITLSKATTTTTTGIRLYDADMQLLSGAPI